MDGSELFSVLWYADRGNSMTYKKLAMSGLLQVLMWPLPWFVRRSMLQFVFGFELASDCRIGFSLVFAQRLKMAPESMIGHFSVFRNLALVELQEGAVIGNFNSVVGVLPSKQGFFSEEHDRHPELILRRHSGITHSHIIDCTNRVIIGEFATMAGWRTQILTHSIDVATNRQRSAPVTIGAYSFVGTGCILLKGAVLPDQSILGAGSVLIRAETEPYHLYSGVPAIKVKQLDQSSPYFSRQSTVVE